MSNVVKVEPHPKNPEWRILTTDDQRQFIIFSAKLADGLEVGKALPQGTSEEPPKFDGALPSLRLPRPQGGGGMTAWRNTKEGFEAETRSRQRWQEIEEEKKDRRTSWMTAVDSKLYNGIDELERVQERIYASLRSSPAPGGREATKTAPGPAQAVPGPSQTSPAGRSHEPAAVMTAGDSTSAGTGEASADMESGGGTSTGATPSPGSTYFPVKPEDCNHKFGTTGNWLKTVQIEGKPHCPRCGMSALLYRESDVGP